MSIDDATLKQLNELIEDASKCPRLSNFEEQFLDDLSTRIAEYGLKSNITEPQWAIIQRIESKVYLT